MNNDYSISSLTYGAGKSRSLFENKYLISVLDIKACDSNCKKETTITNNVNEIKQNVTGGDKV